MESPSLAPCAQAVTTLAAVGIRSPADRVNRDAFRLIIERSPNLLYPAFALQEARACRGARPHSRAR